MKIVFKNLKVQNFLSIGSLELDLEGQNNISFITGRNHDENSNNGAGKSSILEALHYAVVGDTFRNIKKSNLVNKNTTGKNFVNLEFSIDNNEYEIYREIKPSKVIFKVNGVDKTRTINETNADIIKALNIDKNIFQNTLIISNDNNQPFLERPFSEKTKFIESILSLGIFDKLFEVAKNGYNQVKKTKDILEVESEHLNLDVSKIKMLMENFDSEKLAAIQKLESKKETLVKEQESIEVEDLDQEKYRQLHSANVENISRGEKKLYQKQIDLRNSKNKIDTIEKSKVCPTCGRPYSDLHTKEEEVVKEQEKATATKEEIDEINKKLKVLYERRTKLESFKKQIEINNNKRSRIFLLDQQIEVVDDAIRNEQERTNSYSELLSEKQETLKNNALKLADTNGTFLVYDKLKYVYSPDGVKATTIKKIIDLFNTILSDFLIKLNAPCCIVFNEMFEDKVMDKTGNEITYFSLSSGERKRVDLALLFSFRELRRFQSNVTCNVSFFDEIFDSSLDESGMQCCLRIIEEFSAKYDEKHFIITHRSEQVDSTKYNLLKIEKRNGISSLVE